MKFKPVLLPSLIEAIADVIEKNAEEVTALDQAIGDAIMSLIYNAAFKRSWRNVMN